MKVVDWLLNYGARQKGPRDGTARALEVEADGMAPEAGLPASVKSALSTRMRTDLLAGPMERRRRDHLDRKLAEKVLGAYISNRVQTASPLTVNFDVLDDGHAALLIEIAVHAVQAAGRGQSFEEAAVFERLDRFRAGERERGLIAAVSGSMRPIAQLAPDLVAANLAGRAYAVAASLLHRRDEVSSLFLAYLAARLGLGDEEARLIRRRYRN